MEIVVERRGEVVVAAPGGRVDSANAQQLIDRLADEGARGCRVLVVDLERVPYVTSAGFRALLVTEERVHAGRGRLVLCSLAPQVQRLFEMGAFLDHFTIVASREDALALSGVQALP